MVSRAEWAVEARVMARCLPSSCTCDRSACPCHKIKFWTAGRPDGPVAGRPVRGGGRQAGALGGEGERGGRGVPRVGHLPGPPAAADPGHQRQLRGAAGGDRCGGALPALDWRDCLWVTSILLFHHVLFYISTKTVCVGTSTVPAAAHVMCILYLLKGRQIALTGVHNGIVFLVCRVSRLKLGVCVRQSHPSTLEFTPEAANSKVFGTLFSKRVRARACL